MHRRGDDAFDTDYTPAEARLLLPYVIGLSGEFNNTSVALAATNLFIVSPFLCHPSPSRASPSPALFLTDMPIYHFISTAAAECQLREVAKE